MNLPRSSVFCLFVVLWFATVSGALAITKPEELGFSAARLGRLDSAIQDEVGQHRIAGAVMFIARDGQLVHFKAYGLQDIEAAKPMTPDAIFRIASMSKAVTTVAALMLYEEGRFMLNDPVEKFIPAFAHSVVAVTPPADAPAGTKFVTVPAKRPITIRDLMRHTAGLTYGDGLASDLYKAADVQGWNFTKHDEAIGEAVNRLAKLPLHGQPGEQWQYGFGTDVLGHLVEVVSGMPLDRFIAERITGPLKMTDTCFYLPPEKAGRLANVYGLENGRLVLEESTETSAYVHGPRKCFSGGAGLLSTAADYARLLQMLLNGGELDGVRLLSPMTVELMQANQAGDRYATVPRGPGTNSHGFGLGFWVNDDPGFMGELIGEGAYGWGSAYFPQYLVEPKQKIVAIFMTQLLPVGGNDLNQRFKVLVNQALVK